MNEAQTRFNKIDPKLRDAGWGIVPGSNILVEQSAYIAPGRITTTGNKNPKKADYILEYKGMKLAVIEAKSDEKDVSEGVGQAKLYADALKIETDYRSTQFCTSIPSMRSKCFKLSVTIISPLAFAAQPMSKS